MTFNSLQYAAFFAVVLFVYWRLNRRQQNVLLLLGSYVFYGAWDPRFLPLMWLSTAVDYYVGRRLEDEPDPVRRKRIFALSLVVNLGVLATFKYFNFFLDSADGLFALLGADVDSPTLRILLPVGISFYTFHGISYTFDVYRREIAAARRPLDFAVFVAFFPQLVAGPIGRAQLQLPQFQNPRRPPSGERVASALFLILLGLFKKVVLADGVARFADAAFATGTRRLRHPAHRGLRLRDPDLRRLLRLHRHRPGVRAAAGHRAAAQLRAALPVAQHHRVLATLAHLAVELAARLPLHPARREPGRPAQDLPQPHAHDGHRRPLARGGVDLRHLGRPARRLPLGAQVVDRPRAARPDALPAGGRPAGEPLPSTGGVHAPGDGGAVAVRTRVEPERTGPASVPTGLGPILGVLVTFHLVCLAWIFFRADSLRLALRYCKGLVTFRPGPVDSTRSPSSCRRCVVMVAIDVGAAAGRRRRVRAADAAARAGSARRPSSRRRSSCSAAARPCPSSTSSSDAAPHECPPQPGHGRHDRGPGPAGCRAHRALRPGAGAPDTRSSGGATRTRSRPTTWATSRRAGRCSSDLR